MNNSLPSADCPLHSGSKRSSEIPAGILSPAQGKATWRRRLIKLSLLSAVSVIALGWGFYYAPLARATDREDTQTDTKIMLDGAIAPMAGFAELPAPILLDATPKNTIPFIGIAPLSPENISNGGKTLLKPLSPLTVSAEALNKECVWCRAHKYQILSRDDVQNYRIAFALDRAGKFGDVEKVFAKIDNKLLVGVILGERYLRLNMHPSNPMLQQWLVRWNGLPQAYDLAIRIKKSPNYPNYVESAGLTTHPSQFRLLDSIKENAKILVGGGDDLPDWIDDSIVMTKHAENAYNHIEKLLRRGERDAALGFFVKEKAKNKLTHLDEDAMATSLARSFFHAGSYNAAYPLASSATRSADKLPDSAWLAGLVAWTRQDYEPALGYFSQLATSDYASVWSRNRGAFWAARAAEKLGQHEQSQTWLKQAASNGTGFYALLAAERLGSFRQIDFDVPVINDEIWAKLSAEPGVARAMALWQIGAGDLAEKELRSVFLRSPANLQPYFLTLADSIGNPHLTLRFATALERLSGHRYQAGYYPLPKWQPTQGFIIDPALMFGVARIESLFNPQAVSPKGAQGLMQIMPKTAHFYTRSDKSRPSVNLVSTKGFPDNGTLAEVRLAEVRLAEVRLAEVRLAEVKLAQARFSGKSGRKLLQNPELNMGVAQRVIASLLKQDRVQNNLIYMMIAYNGGLGMLNRSIERQIIQDRGGAVSTEGNPTFDDPLLFLERMSADDTRLYVERVLISYWMYQMRMGQAAQSLASLAHAEWPIYQPQSPFLTIRAAMAENATNGND